MGVASAASNAKVRHDTEWLTNGDYELCQVTSMKEVQRPGKLLFIANFDVLMSKGEEAIPAGRDSGICVDCLKFDGAFAGDVVKFLSALTHTPIDEVDEDGINAAVGSSQPFTGQCLAIKAHPKEKKSKPGEFITVYKFFPAKPELVAKVAELRAELGMMGMGAGNEQAAPF